MPAIATKLIASAVLLASAAALASPSQCTVQSGPLRTPVLELYTSEGCSSCPPADQWLSSLKGRGGGAVVQAFHVGYWDYIGWVDRFATPAFTARQRDIAAHNGLGSIYTPQTVLDGRDWRGWGRGNAAPSATEPARLAVSLRQTAPDQFEAMVSSKEPKPIAWSAYWTVTEDSHGSRVKAGENNGEYLQHDYVVRQYVPVGDYKSEVGAPQTLTLHTIAAQAGHARRVNLVIFDTRTLKPLQAISVGC